MISNRTVLYGMVERPGRPFPHSSGWRHESTEALTGKILIAEDDYFVGTTIEQALLDAGHEVIAVVRTGEEAVRESIRLRPDLVLMDIRLAGEMTGIDAALALRAEGITSLFASAHSDAATRSAGDKAKPAGWVTKPFSDFEIVSAVAAALSQMTGH